jgi:hypothetical protein
MYSEVEVIYTGLISDQTFGTYALLKLGRRMPIG